MVQGVRWGEWVRIHLCGNGIGGFYYRNGPHLNPLRHGGRMLNQ